MSSELDKVVLAIDPGRSKCGLALVRRDSDGRLDMLWHGIIPTDTLTDGIAEASRLAEYHLIIVGGGTNSQQVVHQVRTMNPGMGILVVDERETTLQARERYWEFNPRRGWRRILPSSLLVPPAPVDDYVAFILAERVLMGE